LSIVTESIGWVGGLGHESMTLSDSLRRVMTTREAVELHIVSDSTGETAARLVAALEAQFPDQPSRRSAPADRDDRRPPAGGEPREGPARR
jgi:hypothetical protein